MRTPTTKPAKKTFPLGQVVQTAAVAKEVSPIIVAHALYRHKNGDWGDTGPEDGAMNDRALKNGDDRIFSVYASYPGQRKFWIITEHDRSSTCILFPEDY